MADTITTIITKSSNVIHVPQIDNITNIDGRIERVIDVKIIRDEKNQPVGTNVGYEILSIRQSIEPEMVRDQITKKPLYKSDKKFETAFNEKNFEILKSYKDDDTLENRKRSTHYAEIALSKRDKELVQSLNFDARCLVEMVSDKPEELGMLLELIDYNKTFPNGLSGSILGKLTEDTKNVFNNYFVKNKIQDNIYSWYYEIHYKKKE